MALTNTYRNKIVDSLTGRTNTLGTSQIYIGLSPNLEYGVHYHIIP